MPSPPPPFQLLHSLPSELLHEILSHLTTTDLKPLNLASKWTYAHATPLLWQHVTLTDCATTHSYPRTRPPPGAADDTDPPPGGWPAIVMTDDHDDTPLLRKLLILASKPWIAAQVQVLEHRCRVPPPAIFNELPKSTFGGQTLSYDPRAIELVRLAVRGMVKVGTVRIVGGHQGLVDVLLRCLFDRERASESPVRRLWVEGCRVSGACEISFPEHPVGLPTELDFSGLQSVRMRRLPLRPALSREHPLSQYDFVFARGHRMEELQDGQGSLYLATTNNTWEERRRFVRTTISWAPDEAMGCEWWSELTAEQLHEVFELALKWDDKIFETLDEEFGLPEGLPDVKSLDYETRARRAWRGPLLDPADLDELPAPARLAQRERLPTSRVALNLLRSASTTLTSLCLDWVLCNPYGFELLPTPEKVSAWLEIYADLFALRFPNLRAFQYRNAVTMETVLPQGLFLLDHAGPMTNSAEWNAVIPEHLLERLDLACLEFMEAHPSLQCLAWPMEAFFPAGATTSPDIAQRVQAVVDNLGRTLTDLRVDTMYSPHGERQTEDIYTCNLAARNQRRRFIAAFTSQMTKLTNIKVEGGMPRDERRELLRALHRCPLERISLIGVCYPLGNTWGEGGEDLPGQAGGELALGLEEVGTLEAEDKDAIHRLGYMAPNSLDKDFVFEPAYGWPPAPPLLHTIASFHSSTITSLKFCGYKGAPVLYTPTPITSPLVAALKHFHSLRELVMSFCLLTWFEGATRDAEVIGYWMDMRSPATTSLVRVSNLGSEYGDEEAEMGAWERELKTRYAPEAIAGEVVRILGPCLSESAKGRGRVVASEARRTGGSGGKGVNVRASMCLGDMGGIFDIDLGIGKAGGVGKDEQKGDDVCLGFEGPREELEEGRRRGKLEGRRWF